MPSLCVLLSVDQHVKQSYIMPHHADQQTNSVESDTDIIQLWNSNLKHISHFDTLHHYSDTHVIVSIFCGVIIATELE